MLLPKQQLQTLILGVNSILITKMIGHQYQSGIGAIGVLTIGIILWDIVLTTDYPDYNTHQLNMLVTWCLMMSLFFGIIFSLILIQTTIYDSDVKLGTR